MDAAALRQLGLDYAAGVRVRQDLALAEDYLRRAFEAGESECCSILAGLLLRRQLDFDKAADAAQARALLERGAERGLSYALRGLGHCYADGLAGLPRDRVRAAEFYRRACAAGDSLAYCSLLGLLEPAALEAERREFVALMEARIARGDRQAALALGQALCDGRDAPLDPERGLALVEVACQDPDLRLAFATLAAILARLPPTFERSRAVTRALRRAAQLGDSYAIYQIGLQHLLGQARSGVDVPKGVEWIRRSARLGDPVGMASYARVLYGGWLEPPRVEESLRWSRAAADEGSPEGMYQLGVALYTGTGAPRDREQALLWLRRAAEPGHLEARYALALAELEGGAEPAQVEAALATLEAAAASGSPSAHLTLAALRRTGTYLPAAPGAVVEHYRRVAELLAASPGLPSPDQPERRQSWLREALRLPAARGELREFERGWRP